MALSDLINVSITTTSVAVTQQGFGIPLILGVKAISQRVKFYTSLLDMTNDGFATTDPEYLAAAKLLSQSPRPPKFAVGRRDNKPTLQWKIFPTAVNSTVYAFTFNGSTVTYTSDSTATVDEITAGLKTAFDALAQPFTSVATPGSGFLQITANAVSTWRSLSVADGSRALLGVQQTHADPGVTADLNAILLYDATWYGLTSVFASSAEVTAIAAWAESNTRLYVQDSQESAIVTTAAPGSDIAGSLKTSAYGRTAVAFHPDNSQFLGAAWLGLCLPFTPGSETWAYKTLAAVSAVSLTSTERTNALAKNCTVYETVAGVNFTEFGKVAGGEYIDVVRGRDWLSSRMQTRILALLLGQSKVPYTDPGIAQVENEVRGQLTEGESNGLLVKGKSVVTVPLLSAVSSGDKTSRTLNNVNFTAQLAGAIHLINITGVVSV